MNLGILGEQAEIVGITAHVKALGGLDSDARATIQAQFYFPLMQVPDKFMPLLSKGIQFVMRTRVPPYTLLGAIRRTVEQLNSQQVVYGEQTMEETIADSLAARRFAMDLLAVSRCWRSSSLPWVSTASFHTWWANECTRSVFASLSVRSAPTCCASWSARAPGWR